MPRSDDFEEIPVNVWDDEPRPAEAEQAQPDSEPQEDAGDDIVVTVDAAAIVREVSVPRDWRKRMRPHQLGQALLAAATAAVTEQCVEHWRTFDIDAEVRRASASTSRDAPSAGGDPDGPVARALTEEILGLIERIPQEQDDLLNQARAAAAAQTRTAGPGGHITVSMTGRQITAVDIAPKWALMARYLEIEAEAAAAFRSAQRTAPPLGPDTTVLPPAMARLRELVADPVALTRQLGLTNR